MALHVLGVRHHSPACARLVEASIRSLRPRWVLIEGPADMNGRLDELLLDHEPPVALFTFYHREERTHASWSPFCRSSPEWVALRTAREVGATPLFMDLPAWTEPFEGIHNRYGDHHAGDERIAGLLDALCARFRVDDQDALWDHLFELPLPLEELAARLDAYFEELRGDLPGGPRDGPREDFMLRFLGWALAEAEAQGGDVVAVCGGFHAPVLRREARPEGSTESPCPVPPSPEEGARSGSYLVPYSFHRLDSFTGYESGMPSPAFYDVVWAEGPEAAPERLLRSAVERLRGKKQLVSAADVIAASSLAAALARTRGHACLARTDLLDGLAGALVKDALDAPLPWSYRGMLRPRTDPLLVEVMAAFSGDRSGRLDARTPRPPLLADALAWLAAHDLEPAGSARMVRLDLTAERDRTRSRGLHRLRVLGIPGFIRERGPAPGSAEGFEEVWKIFDVFERESALIEAAAWGATLESAAAARLEEALLAADGRLATLARLLAEAVLVGLDGLGLRVLDQVALEVHREPSLVELGAATNRLAGLWRHDPLLGARGARQLGVILEAAFDRGLWLLEGIQGATAPADPGVLLAMGALRDLVRFGRGKLAVDPGRAAAVMERRMADLQAPPAVRGGALGVLWSLGLGGEDLEDRAVRAIRSAALPSILGDFLAGLCALAREEVVRSEGLLAAIDEALTALGREDFLIALPSLRLAFTYFPPEEKEQIAGLILRRHGGDPAGAREMLRMRAGAQEVVRGLELEARVSELAARYGLTPENAPEDNR